MDEIDCFVRFSDIFASWKINLPDRDFDHANNPLRVFINTKTTIGLRPYKQLMYNKKEDRKVSIRRNKETKEATLEIEIKGDWKLYAGCSVENIDRTAPLLTGKGKGNFALAVALDKRSYFELETAHNKIILAERLLPMTGGYNFRDLGGIETTDGRYLKWGKLFRADELTHLTDDDLTYLTSIPLTSSIDFRALSESRRAPDRLPPTVLFTYPISITPGNLSSEGIQANMLKKNISLHMRQMNRLLVSDPPCVRAYKTLFTIIQHKLSAPIVYHCSAGKDRTGMATALILFALGVDEDTIMEDYLASKIYLTDKYASFIAKYPRAEPIFTVRSSYLKAGIAQIKKEHKSVDNFLRNVLNVDIEKMKELYLEEY